MDPWNDPSRKESVPCPLCEAPAADSVVVGLRARFGMDVRNVACERCGLVRVEPRPSPEAMDAYYRGPYREQYKNVKLPGINGGFVGPDDPGYMETRAARYSDQAIVSLQLGQLEPGARVLEVGCRDGQTLTHMQKLGGVEVFGVEPGPAEAEEARARGIDVFVGLLEELTLGEGGNAPGFPAELDQVQMFHVLEHLHDPLGALIHLGSWLRPGGRLIIEVPNVTHPYGALEGNFFQNAHLTSFSANTLCGLMRRAGLEPERVVDASTLFVVATRPEEATPRAFEEAMLDRPEETGAWIADRLDTYRLLERAKAAIRGGGNPMHHLMTIAGLVDRPAFPDHVVETVRELAAWLVRANANRAATALARAAASGPHPARVTGVCRVIAARCASAGAPALHL